MGEATPEAASANEDLTTLALGDGADPLPTSHGYWVPYMETAAPSIPDGIRPGAWIQAGSHYCTAAFVVEDQTGGLYLTTAAHCTDHVGQRVSVMEGTLVAAAGQWEPFGTVVEHWPGWNLDAALIEIDEDHHDDVDPSMPGWGGPTGIATDAPEGVFHYGWGWVTWQEHQNRCRDGPSVSWGSQTWWANTTGGGGDSGSGVLTDSGEALGILAWGRQLTNDPIGGAFIAEQLGGTRFDVALDALEGATGLDLELVEGDDVSAIEAPDPVGTLCEPEPPTPAAP